MASTAGRSDLLSLFTSGAIGIEFAPPRNGDPKANCFWQKLHELFEARVRNGAKRQK
jgi:hypothetical protein